MIIEIRHRPSGDGPLPDEPDAEWSASAWQANCTPFRCETLLYAGDSELDCRLAVAQFAQDVEMGTLPDLEEGKVANFSVVVPYAARVTVTCKKGTVSGACHYVAGVLRRYGYVANLATYHPI